MVLDYSDGSHRFYDHPMTTAVAQFPPEARVLDVSAPAPQVGMAVALTISDPAWSSVPAVPADRILRPRSSRA